MNRCPKCDAPLELDSHFCTRCGTKMSEFDSLPGGMVTVEVWDATGSKKRAVELPSEAPVNRILAVLVDRMNMPRHSPDGQLMSYKFHHKATGRQLLDEETLQEAGVKDSDILRLQPEITAGGELNGKSQHRKD